MTLANGGGIIRDPSVLQDFSRGYSVVNVKDYGATGNGVTDDTAAIQAAVNACPVGGIVYFPPGTYMISATLHLLPQRTYQGAGWGSTIQQMNGTNLVQLIDFGDTSSTHQNVVIRDIQFDGNKMNNTTTVGLYLFGLSYSMLYRVRVQNCPGTGFFIDGNTSAGYTASTNHFVDCWSYGNGGYGIYFSSSVSDNHILGGDYGYNFNAALCTAGPSNSAKSATFWGSTSASSVIFLTGADSCQLVGNNIEGSSGHGVEVHANHIFINGNKIYDNANTPANYGLYDGVYVNGTSSANVQGVVIDGNKIYAGLYANTGYYRYAINLDTYHQYCRVTDNEVRFAKQNNVADTTDVLVNGITSTDVFDGAPSLSVSDMKITSTSATTVASLTPWFQSNYEIRVYYRVTNAPTNLTVTATYTDGSGTLQTINLVDGASQPVGAQYVTAFVNATSASPITVTATAGTANNVYVSCTIKPE
jgi:hypothetical protein